MYYYRNESLMIMYETLIGTVLLLDYCRVLMVLLE